MNKLLKWSGIAAIAVSLLSFNLYLVTDYKLVAEKISIKFSGSDGAGTFSGLKVDIKFDENDLTNSTISATVDVKTVDLGSGGKTKHALSADYFEAEKYPTITFTSKSISKTSEGFEVLGDLTLKGVTKEVKLPFTFTSDATGGVFKGKLSIIRGEFGITKNLKAETKIEIEVPVVKG